MTNTSLLVLNGWEPPALAQFVLERQSELKAALALYNQPIKTQEQADEVAALIGECERWETDVEEASAATRKPYFDYAKKIKETTDTCQRVIIEARRPVQGHLADFEAEKLRVKQQLERQAREEAERLRREEEQRQREAEAKRQAEERAERERLAEIGRKAAAEANAKKRAELEAAADGARAAQEQALARRQSEIAAEQARLAAIAPKPVTWEAPKTEGVRAAVALEYDITDDRAFAEWCWANGRVYWVRRVEFDRRGISEELRKVPDTSPVPQIPGLTIRRVAAVNVAKAKKQRTHDVATTRVEL